jgi:hypothetical protein
MNPNSNDYLLLHSFIFLADPEFFCRIKDKSIFISWLPKSDYYSLRAFVKVCHYLPEDLLLKTIETIGLNKIVRLYQYDGLDLNVFPQQIVVRLYAKVITYNSIESTEWETVESGGHFTWGEGWQESYTTYKNTYIDKDCAYDLYAETNSFDIIKQSLSIGKVEIDKQVRSCIEQKKASCLFVEAANEKQVFLSLELHETTPGLNYIHLFTGTRQTIRIISKREVEQ